MTLKLNEFHLESYDERSALGLALDLFDVARYPEYKEAVAALKLRLSRTECQPGGCSICRPDLNPDDWEEVA